MEKEKNFFFYVVESGVDEFGNEGSDIVAVFLSEKEANEFVASSDIGNLFVKKGVFGKDLRE